MKIIIEDKEYELIKNINDGFDEDAFKDKYTDYFYDYDYILGDWAYSKLRLKGFNEKNNKNFKPINDYKTIDKYITDNCAYGCKHFILKKIK